MNKLHETIINPTIYDLIRLRSKHIRETMRLKVLEEDTQEDLVEIEQQEAYKEGVEDAEGFDNY